MKSVRLRHVAAINPATPAFDRLPDDVEVTFLPLEAVWPSDGLDVSRTRRKKAVASGYTRYADGDVVVPKITPTFEADRSTIARAPHVGVGAGTTELHVVRAGPRAEARYINHLLSSAHFLQGGKAEMTGVAGQQRVPDEWLRDFVVSVTDLRRQRAVADFLDAETARIDALIAKKQTMMSMLVERRDALIENATFAVGGELLPLRRLARFIDYRGATPEKASEGIPLVTASHIAEGFIELDVDPQYLSSATYASWMRRGLPSLDDVVMTTEAPLGQVAQIDSLPVALAQRVILLKSDPSLILSTFLAYALRSASFQSQLHRFATGSTALGIKAARLRGLTIRVPSLTRQQDSVARLLEVSARMRGIEIALREQRQKLKERRQALITAAVTGQMEIPVGGAA